MSRAATKDQIQKDFGNLLASFKKEAAKILTKEEISEKQKEQDIVDSASAYTVENIVKGLADLQLYFEELVKNNAGKLEKEASKLDELRKAIQIENTHINELKNVRLAADALYILKKEQTDRLEKYRNSATETRENLDNTIEETREFWKEEETTHEASGIEYETNKVKERQREEEEFTYKNDRQTQVDTDAFDEKKRQLSRDLSAKEETKVKDWSQRESTLEDGKEGHKENTTAIEKFEGKLETAVKKARESARSKTARDAEHQAALFQADVDGKRQVFELKVKSLDNTITKQTARITELEKDRQNALKEVNNSISKALASAQSRKDNS